MTEKERLIELLQNVPADCEGNRGVGAIADYLLANDIVAPPVKVGDRVYVLYKLAEVAEAEVTRIEYICEAENYSKFIKKRVFVSLSGSAVPYDFYEIGKLMFLTREEAEKALKERKKGVMYVYSNNNPLEQ